MFKNLITFIKKFLTTSGGSAEISQTREVLSSTNREVTDSGHLPADATHQALQAGAGMTKKPVMDSLSCPYCHSQNFQKRGFRQKVMEKVQLYLCLSCKKTFTPHSTKGKHYPLEVMLDAISIYNLGYSLEKTCDIVNQRQRDQLSKISATSAAERQKTASYEAANGDSGMAGQTDLSSKNTLQQINADVKGQLRSGPEGNRTPGIRLDKSIPNQSGPTQNLLSIRPSTLSTWLSETAELCRFSRMREFALKKYSPREMVIHTTLAHRQLYRYRFHRAKCALMIQEEYQHRKFTPLSDFLEMVPVECPHQYFQKGLRASETPLTFSKKQMIVRAKQNYATKIAAFVLQSVKERKQRHEALQKFFLANDSVTVATEVPVYLTQDDLLHMKTQLGFEIYQRTMSQKPKAQVTVPEVNPVVAGDADVVNNKNSASGDFQKKDNNTGTGIVALPRLITGHIDLLQIRNGQIHILDYKPNAEKERPIEQLTLYAMALSRLTGLRLFEFKCAWFDEKDYFEFYPLHVLHKTKKGARRRKVTTSEGVYTINKNPDKVERIRPI